MATTSLWHIKGRLSDLIDYVENPEKTVPKGTEDFFNVFDYVRREDKTKDQYVTAINCIEEIALQQMILTKQQYGKTDGYIAWHGYQSFQIGEVAPEIAHEIGVKLAREMWGDRFQIVVTTHLDKDHIHNHFAFNSVSFKDGGKYNYSKKELQRLRDCSDDLCREYELSVIEKPHKAPSRPVWLDENSGKPTRYNVYREDIREALSNSNSISDMERFLIRLGYETDFSGKHWKIKLPQYKNYTRIDTLNKEWTPEGLEKELGRSKDQKSIIAKVTFSPHIPYRVRTYYQPFTQPKNIHKLYVYYCYMLGYYPRSEYFKPKSPFLKESLRQLDKYSSYVNYMSKHGIETMDDLLADRAQLENSRDKLIDERRRLQNKIRRASPEDKEKLRAEKSEITNRITSIRNHLKINYGIEEHSNKIQATMDYVVANEAKAQGKAVDKMASAEGKATIRKEKDFER